MLKIQDSNKFIFKFLDWFSASLVWFIFFSFRKYYVDHYPIDVYNLIEDQNFIYAIIALPLFWLAWYAFTGQYVNVYRQSRLKIIFATFWQSLIGVLAIFFVLLLDDQVGNYKKYYVTFSFLLVAHFLLTSFFRVLLLTIVKHKMAKGDIVINALIVGNKANAHRFYEDFLNNPLVYAYHIKGVVTLENDDKNSFNDLPCLGVINDLEQICEEHEVKDVVIAVEKKEHLYINKIILILSLKNVFIRVIPSLYDILSGSVNMGEMVGSPLIDIYPDAMRPWQQNTKRLLDASISLVTLILLIPVYLIVAIIVKLDDGGSIFYWQERIGKGGRKFKLYKFRSMKENAEPNGPALSSDNDNRITNFGKIMRKWRIDELPQFWNVLKGDMSLIGPRPEREYFIQEMGKLAPEVKHLQRVKPGITSLGMVKFGYAQNVNEMIERLKYDILYIEKKSLGMDFKIFLYTIVTLLKGRGK